ncbi:hypothetical protein ZWY2020_027732 [Hordeum vulgare]|nr:hypothetical protein ZWY2020_027732 [Hordeum vulgare]
MRAAPKPAETLATAAVTSGQALTSLPMPPSMVPATPAGSSMHAAPSPILPRPCGSSGGFSGKELLQQVQPSSDAFNLCSWRVVRPAHWWRKQPTFMPHQRQMGSSGQHSRQKREGATLRQKQRKVWKEVPTSVEDLDYHGLELDTLVFCEKHDKASMRHVAFEGTSETVADLKGQMAKKDEDHKHLNEKYQLLVNLTRAQAAVIQNLKLKHMKENQVHSEAMEKLELKNAELTKS